jgi:hypothetical protein
MPYRTLEEIYAEKITVTHNPQVKLTLDADDWALYDDFDNHNRINVAVALNDRISNAINTSASRDEAFKRCLSILSLYSDGGAYDTEGRDTLYVVFNLVYGKNND